MTPELKYKAEKCGSLLARSPLDDTIKDAIIENLDKMTELQLDLIIKSLERETIELSAIKKLLLDFDAHQNLAWEKLEGEQKNLTDKMGEETLKEVGVGK
ncbi:MAG: hypothetical protein ABIF06_01300 [bacterium]